MKSKVSIFSLIVFGLLVTLTLAVNALRFFDLENVPRGFQVDEAAMALTSYCIASEGIDPKGRKFPLFVDLSFGSPKPPTAVYLGALWHKMFGPSIATQRSISGLAVVVALLGLFFLAKLMFGWRYALWVVLVGSISPWIWIFSRVGYESILAIPFLIWGILFFLRSEKQGDMLFSSLLISLAMYSYPPTRLQAPLGILVLMGMKMLQKRWKWRSFFTFSAFFIGWNIPLVMIFLKGGFSYRLNNVVIWASEYWHSIGQVRTLKGIIFKFFENFVLHFNFNFLFVSGDNLCVHSTGQVGLWSWLDMVAFASFFLVGVFYCLRRNKIILERSQCPWLVFVIVMYLLGIVPAALTWEGLPHSLRAIGGWPFLCLLSGFALWHMDNLWSGFKVIFLSVALAFVVYFLSYYFGPYPDQSAGFFSPWMKEDALAIDSEVDALEYIERYHGSDYQTRFYIIRYAGETCSSSQEQLEFVKKMREMLKEDSKRMPIE